MQRDFWNTKVFWNTDFWNTKPHTEQFRRSQATPASSNLLHQYFQPLQFLTAHYLPLIYSWCVFYTWFTIKSQTSSNLKFGKYFHKIQSWSSTTWHPVVSVPPALPSSTAILECLTSIWQFWRLAEQFCPQEHQRRFSAFSQCQIKPAVFLTECSMGEPSMINTSQMGKNNRRLRSPSSQTPVQLRKEDCHPLICTASEIECVRILTSRCQPG